MAFELWSMENSFEIPVQDSPNLIRAFNLGEVNQSVGTWSLFYKAFAGRVSDEPRRSLISHEHLITSYNLIKRCPGSKTPSTRSRLQNETRICLTPDTLPFRFWIDRIGIQKKITKDRSHIDLFWKSKYKHLFWQAGLEILSVKTANAVLQDSGYELWS